MGTAWLEADWPAPASVRAFTTLRHGLGASVAPFDHFNLGNRYAAEGDDPATVERNRTLLVERAGLPAMPRWLRQVHGVEVVRFGASSSVVDASLTQLHAQTQGVNERLGITASPNPLPNPSPEGRGALTTVIKNGDNEPEADASVTSTPGVVLAILTADCLPVLFCARDGSEVAGAHAGWRGLVDGVLEATIAAMRTPASELLAWLGPAAGPASYEVGVDVYDAFVSRDWCAGAAFVSTRPLHWRVDLYALARLRLAACGIDDTRVFGGGLDTIADPHRFFSHRRDRRTGRMASVIWMQP